MSNKRVEGCIPTFGIFPPPLRRVRPSVPLLVFGALAVAAAGVAVSKFAALTGEVAV